MSTTDPTPQAKRRREFPREYKPKSMLDRKRVTMLAEEITMLPGGFDTFLKWFKAAAIRYKKYQPILDMFYELPIRQQNAIYLEEICLVMAVNPAEMFGDCVEIAYEHKLNTTRALISLATPKVMARNIKEALKAKGVEDRRMFLTAAQVLPSPKGSVINVTANAQSAALNPSATGGLPSFEDSTLIFSDIVKRAAELPPATLPDAPDPLPSTDEEE